MNEARNFWKFTDKADVSGNNSTERELRIDGVIAEESWWDDDVTPKMFKDELFRRSGDVTVWINSPGGDVFAAAQIYNMIVDYSHKGNGRVTVKVDALAASAASVIAMAGDEIQISPVGQFMIHNPWTFTWGDAQEITKAVNALNACKETIINAYQRKTNMSRKKLSELMDEEKWIPAREAVDMGFADKIIRNSQRFF